MLEKTLICSSTVVLAGIKFLFFVIKLTSLSYLNVLLITSGARYIINVENEKLHSYCNIILSLLKQNLYLQSGPCLTKS